MTCLELTAPTQHFFSSTSLFTITYLRPLRITISTAIQVTVDRVTVIIITISLAHVAGNTNILTTTTMRSLVRRLGSRSRAWMTSTTSSLRACRRHAARPLPTKPRAVAARSRRWQPRPTVLRASGRSESVPRMPARRRMSWTCPRWRMWMLQSFSRAPARSRDSRFRSQPRPWRRLQPL